MNPVRDQRLECLERLDLIATCWRALGDLMNPGLDIQEPQRDNVSVLMDFLSSEYDAANKALRQALRD